MAKVKVEVDDNDLFRMSDILNGALAFLRNEIEHGSEADMKKGHTTPFITAAAMITPVSVWLEDLSNECPFPEVSEKKEED